MDVRSGSLDFSTDSGVVAEHDFVVLDVETTGLSAYHDSVIEIAALHITNGAISATFHSLIDPGVRIPSMITRLTGINEKDLLGQPSLRDVLDDFLAFLGARTFVAHNASFDYNFVIQGLRRHGVTYVGNTLCTMLLGRRLLPLTHGASLDRLLAHCAITRDPKLGTHHRAMPDAEATARLFLHLARVAAGQGITTLAGLKAIQKGTQGASRAQGPDLARGLPTSPGVYLMRDDKGQILYIGKSKDVRHRVQTHLRTGDPTQPRLKRALPYVKQIDAVETGSELEALLLESRLIKQYLPAANVALRDYHNYPFIRIDMNEPFPRASMTRDPEPDGSAYFGPFTRSGPVHTAMELVERAFKLACCTGPIVPGVTPSCIYGQMGRCTQPCTGTVTQEEYRGQVDKARRFLDGADNSIITELEARRDQLAEDLRFEEAAEVRDQIAELDFVFGAQQQLNFALSEHNVVIITESSEAGAAELFLVRAGRVSGQHRWRRQSGGRSLLWSLLQRVYSEQHKISSTVAKELIDELHIIQSWLRHNTDRHRKVTVNPETFDVQELAMQVSLAVESLLAERAKAAAR
jgi:DNA polymerase-3 subunit epsilon